jgi:hypothetical protein
MRLGPMTPVIIICVDQTTRVIADLSAFYVEMNYLSAKVLAILN